MRLSVLAARDERATKRIDAAAAQLEERYGATWPALTRAEAADLPVAAMRDKERLADFMEAMLEAAPGVGPATVAKVREYLHEAKE